VILPGGCIIPKDPRQLQGKRWSENHSSWGLGEPEDKFFHRSSGWVEFLLGDLFDGYGGRAFEVTATAKTARVEQKNLLIDYYSSHAIIFEYRYPSGHRRHHIN